jgi:hypothetical protein
MELTNDNKENSKIIKEYIDIRIKEEKEKLLHYTENLIKEMKNERLILICLKELLLDNISKGPESARRYLVRQINQAIKWEKEE